MNTDLLNEAARLIMAIDTVEGGKVVVPDNWFEQTNALLGRIRAEPALERLGYLCIQGYPGRICSGCTSACCEPVFAYKPEEK